MDPISRDTHSPVQKANVSLWREENSQEFYIRFPLCPRPHLQLGQRPHSSTLACKGAKKEPGSGARARPMHAYAAVRVFCDKKKCTLPRRSIFFRSCGVVELIRSAFLVECKPWVTRPNWSERNQTGEKDETARLSLHLLPWGTTGRFLFPKFRNTAKLRPLWRDRLVRRALAHRSHGMTLARGVTTARGGMVLMKISSTWAL